MRRLLVHVALVACFLLIPAAGAQAADPPTGVTAQFVAGSPPHITVSFTPAPLVMTTHVRMCQSSVSCDPATGTSLPVAFPATSVDVPVDVTDFGCSINLVSEDPLGGPDSDPAPATPLVVPQCDQLAPALTTSFTGGNGCAPFVVSGSAVDQGSVVPVFADSVLVPLTVTSGAPFASVNVTVTATDAVLNTASATVTGQVEDPTPPGVTSLEITTDPALQKATLNWDPVPIDGAPLLSYRVRTKGPQGLTTSTVTAAPVVVQNLQVDATYEFTLDALDACNRFGPSSVRLVRLNDTTPPSMPIVAGPAFNPASHVVTLSWVASTDNIQVDHYEILRDGVPLGATDATVFTDVLPAQHAKLSYVVRAVDTNGNDTDSAPAPIMTPDWTPPTAPVPMLTVRGTTVTLRWPAAADNVGVVGYDVLRDDKQRASMTAAERTYNDISVPPGVHTWKVRSRDDAQLSAVSAPQTLKISKPRAHASVLSMRLVGGGSGAARYSLKARTRLLLDLRVVGTLPKAKLHLYLSSGRGRITVWRGTPGSSAPRLRLGSRLAHPGFVTVRLSRALHAGHIRLVLIPSGQMVIVGKGAHKPAMTFG
jgi:hypothetical protein